MGIDHFWMQQARDYALFAQEKQEIPVGALIIQGTQLLGTGYNQVLTQHDPCAHAEILAIKAAAKQLANHRLLNTTLYVTLEPCPMCMGAILQARIKRLVFATRDFKTGAAGSVWNLAKKEGEKVLITIDEGILEKECSALLADFFKRLRG